MANNNFVPTAIVRQLLDEDNYDDWSVQVETYLVAQDLWDVVEAPIPSEAETEAEKAWYKRNAAALHAIQISCSSNTFNVIRKIRLAKEAWDTLATNFSDSSSETESNSSSETESDDPGRNENNDEYTQEYNQFFNNVGKGNWTATQEFIRLHPEAVRVRSPISNRTALQVAVVFGHLHIVEQLVNLMTPLDLEIKEKEHNKTAFHIAVEKGNISMAKCMVEKNHNLLSITDIGNYIPIVIAVITGQKQMARYLYPLTVEHEVLFSNNGMHGAELMIHCIYNKMFDIVFGLIKREPLLVISKNQDEENPMARLACLSTLFLSGCQLKFWQQWIYNCTHVQFPGAINDVCLNIQNAEDHASNKRGITIGYVWSGLLQWMASNFLKHPGINHIYELKLVHIQSRELLNRICKVIQTLDEKQIEDAGITSAVVEAASRGMIEYVTDITKAIPKTVWSIGFAFDIFMSAIRNREAKVFSLIYGLDDKQAIANLGNSSNDDGLLHMTGYIANSRKLNLIAGIALQMQREKQWYKEVEAITPEGSRLYTNNDGKRPHEVFTENHKDLMIAGEKWMKNTSSSCTVVGAVMIAFCAVIALLFQSQIWIVVPTILLASIPVILFVGLQFPLLVEIFVSTYGRSIFDRNVGNWLA